MKAQNDVDRFVAAQVHSRREKLGLKQTQLAEITGIAQSTLNKIEKYGHPLSHRSLYRLACAFGVDVGDILPPTSKDLTKGVDRGGAEKVIVSEIKSLARQCAERQLEQGTEPDKVQPNADDWADFEALVGDASEDDFAMTVFIREHRARANEEK